MQQWEYLVVTIKGVGSDRTVHAVNGEELRNFPLPKMHILINCLSEEGWEMTGTVSSDNCKLSELFFKRNRLWDLGTA